MSDAEPQIPPPELAPEPLDSAPARPDTGLAYVLQFFAGFFSFWLLLLGIVGAVIMGSMMKQSPPYGGLVLAVSLLFLATGAVLLGWRARRGRGLVTGLLVGAGMLGLAGLGAGLCFALVK